MGLPAVAMAGLAAYDLLQKDHAILQLLRLRHRQRHRGQRRLRDRQAPHVRRCHAAACRPPRRGCPAVGEGARRLPRSPPDVPAGLGRQRLGDELRLASGAAIRALNLGAAKVGCLHNTGEGGLSEHHLHGGDLVFQIGTGYFGCRDRDGRFSLAALRDTIGDAPIRALEIKLSQGAKPGLGGFLPAVKVTPEIARIRGIPAGEDCVSPSRHTAFTDADSMLDFVEMLADATGLPVGIKSAVGDLSFWVDLAAAMGDHRRGVDFVTIDGGEGGTGAAPLVFSDSVAFPLRTGFAKAYGAFARAGVAQDVTWIASGKCGLPDNALVLLALGADMVNVAREAMMSIGCIQSQRCHTGKCPTGIATQNPWLGRGVDPPSKAERLANYVGTLRRELVRVSEAVGVVHPGLVTSDDIEIMDRTTGSTSLGQVFGYEPGWGLPSPPDRAAITAIMRSRAVSKVD